MRKPSIYVASSWSNRDLVSSYLDKLRAAGLHVTHDWTAPNELSPEGIAGEELPLKVQRVLAAHDARGVVQADVLWLITPTKAEGGCGCFVELGIATTLRSCFIVVSGASRTIFQSLAQVSFDTHEKAFEAISGSQLHPGQRHL
jgi:hypothetical protein